MRLATVKVNGKETGGVVTRNGIILIKTINEKKRIQWAENLFCLICEGQLVELNKWYLSGGKDELESYNSIPSSVIPFDKVTYAPLYRNPRKIFGIGLNYADHAKDLGERTPHGIPGSFFKPATTIVGHGDTIELPLQSNDVDGEGELAVIIGKECENIEAGNWLDYVAGFTTSLDMTAIDILQQNPRYLTVAKSFKTFFGFGPHLVTPDEIEDVLKLRVETVHNNQVHATDIVANMTFPPDFLVSFHSKVMKWLPGDVLSTGTPLGAHIHDGDMIEGRVSGFESIKCNVVDRKLHKN
ncbi:MAG: fumarylacetoacetate hydrolase family protein [Synergistaceae bacterium]|nr:fumarylacetoacetate hydrolase family protein [Synergistaceae bacterium]